MHRLHHNYAVSLVAATVALLPAKTFAAANTFQELAFEVVAILDVATFTAILFGLVVYFWGIAVNIPHFGDEKGAEKRRDIFFWGLIALFVMVSIWGIIQLLQNTLFGNQSSPGDVAAETTYLRCDEDGVCSFGE